MLRLVERFVNQVRLREHSPRFATGGPLSKANKARQVTIHPPHLSFSTTGAAIMPPA